MKMRMKMRMNEGQLRIMNDNQSKQYVIHSYLSVSHYFHQHYEHLCLIQYYAGQKVIIKLIQSYLDQNIIFNFIIMQIAKLFKRQLLLVVIFTVFCGISIVSAVEHRQINGGTEQISTPINTVARIQLPIDKVFELNSADSDPTFNKYLTFKPTALALQLEQNTKSIILPGIHSSVLQDLRSFESKTYKYVFPFTSNSETFILLFLIPNKVVIVKETEYTFQIHKKYSIKEALNDVQVRMFSLGDKVLAVLNENADQVYILGSQGYTTYQNGQNSKKIANIQYVLPIQSHPTHFIACQMNNLSYYKRNASNSKIIQLFSFNFESFNVTSPLALTDSIFIDQIGDISTFLLLDANLGIIQASIDLKKGKIEHSQLLIKEKGCISMDISMKKEDKREIAMICQNNNGNFLIQAIIQKQNNGTYFKLSKKSEPIYNSCPSDDIQMAQQYFLTFQANSIDVYWNFMLQDSNLRNSHRQKLHMSNLQAFKLVKTPKQLYLYAVKSFNLLKYRIKIEDYSIQVQSPTVQNKQFQLKTVVPCSYINSIKFQKITHQNQSSSDVCIYNKILHVNFHGMAPLTKQQESTNLGLILVISACLLSILWICYIKYRGLERRTQQILQKYRKANKMQQQAHQFAL